MCAFLVWFTECVDTTCVKNPLLKLDRFFNCCLNGDDDDDAGGGGGVDDADVECETN